MASDLTAQLDSPDEIARFVATLTPNSRLVLSLFALAEAVSWPLVGLWHSAKTLGVEPRSALLELLDLGLLAIDVPGEFTRVDDFLRWLEPETYDSVQVSLKVHPAVARGIRITCPEETLTPVAGRVVQVRESDGLEPIIRLAAIWQRVRLEPLRETQQGTLYKRDQERIDDDPILSGASSDALETVPGMPALWLLLAHRAGLIVADSSGERLQAASPEFWTENAVHLPQMIATSWLGLRASRKNGNPMPANRRTPE